jgi:hypothetical protein
LRRAKDTNSEVLAYNLDMKRLSLLLLLLVVACVPTARPLLVYKASIQQIQDALVSKGLQTQATPGHNFYSPVAIGEGFLTLEATPLTGVALFLPVPRVRLSWTLQKRGDSLTAVAVDVDCGRGNCDDMAQVFINDLTVKFNPTSY